MNKTAQVIICCDNLNQEMNFFVSLGFKLTQVFPADNPLLLVLSGFGLNIRLMKGKASLNIHLQLPENQKNNKSTLTSPSGVKICFNKEHQTEIIKPKITAFSLNKFDQEKSWVTGRAGMLYRDLISNRLSGVIIASNIMIPKGGPVPDHVHYHSIDFQLIFCVKGWVKVVYEDQGDPFILQAGDCVTQPPEIRHQVLEASDGLEVIEIGLPAEHMTTLDYKMPLPTGKNLPGRAYNGQRFCHHIGDKAIWSPWKNNYLLKCETTVLKDSNGIAAVNVIKSKKQSQQTINIQHQNYLRFYYVIEGRMHIINQNEINTDLMVRDSFLLPAGQSINITDISADLQCLEFVLMN